MTRRATLLVGGTLRSTVTFDQLDALQVHALLAALMPGRVLGALPEQHGKTYATHLGGGKPFGYGSVVASLVRCTISRTADRYQAASGGGDPTDWAHEPFPFKDAVARIGRFTATLPSLARLLDLDGLAGKQHLVTYPPGSDWEDYQHPDSKRADRFGQSYDWFGKANGEQLARETRPWEPLPSAVRDPELPIRPRRRR